MIILSSIYIGRPGKLNKQYITNHYLKNKKKRNKNFLVWFIIAGKNIFFTESTETSSTI